MEKPFEFLYLDYTDPSIFGSVFAVILILFIFRYFLVSWLYNFIFRRGKASDDHRILVKQGIRREQLFREIRWAMISSVIFALITVGMIIAWQAGVIHIYTDWSEWPLWYIPVSIIAILFLHEAYYYWLHRWMHLPGVYRHVHKVHHDSVHTSVYTAFSFHPVESLLQAIFLPLVLMIVPVHLVVFIAILVFMTISATINHAGVEVYPAGRIGRWMGKWLVGSTHHHVHHTRFRYNFGLYFTFWDKWMNTENHDFEEEYNRIIER